MGFIMTGIPIAGATIGIGYPGIIIIYGGMYIGYPGGGIIIPGPGGYIIP